MDERSTPGGAARWLTRNSVECLPDGDLERKLAEGRPLRVKLGVDPTAPDLTLGHTVVLQKLAEFQQLGHTAVLIIGDGTTQVGDPSGRSSTRPMLDPEQIAANAATYQEQAFKILDRDRTEIRHNADWLMMGMPALFRLLSTTTVATVVEREDFARRLADRTPISMLELLYPLLQGYDSVAVRADVELGGTDQTFNLLMGRSIQRAYGLPGQAILTVPLLVGTDGEKKMSKSLGNYVGVAEPAAEIYGKTLSVPDAALPQWYDLLLGEPLPTDVSPRDAKRALARALADRFAGPGRGAEAEAAFDRVFVRGELPIQVPEFHYDTGGEAVHLPALMAAAFRLSTSEARRLLSQGGVRLDGEPLAAEPLDRDAVALGGRVLSLGKRRHVRLHLT
ncbi:tyrosine--tRNA ligase [Conexibacter sp. DBS9H8]|uniref:tyrosine--tRNA ligase n=1 Tax=Conexibacter sp. DBS9H8 TaxID=2937801 RepID=UPI00200DD087|nr:tyrosine--tRNA ligase [Conexibacter sp. DBS9H8]